MENVQTKKLTIAIALVVAAGILLGLTMAACNPRVGGEYPYPPPYTDDEQNESPNNSTEDDTPRNGHDEAYVPAMEPADGVSIMPPELTSRKQGWGLGPARDDMGRPRDAVQFQEILGHLGAMFIGDGGQANNQVFLTFDQGYENGFTPKILDALRVANVPAVFFVTRDYVQTNPDLIQRKIAEGHVIANHTWSHPSLPDVSHTRVQEEITRLHTLVRDEFGVEMNLFRPPMGEFSEQTLFLTRELGYTSVFWSFAYADWNVNNQPDPATARQKIVDSAHPGAIILLHAVSRTNAEILGDVITDIRARGFEFARLG